LSRNVDIFNALYGCKAASGAGRKGAPSDIKVDDKDMIWATDDRNGTLLVIAQQRQSPARSSR